MLFVVTLIWIDVICLACLFFSSKGLWWLLEEGTSLGEEFNCLITITYGVIGALILLAAWMPTPINPKDWERVFMALCMSPYYLLPGAIYLIVGFMERHKEVKDSLARARAKWEADRAREVSEILRKEGIE